jgi:hypothetical protein
VPMRSLRLTTSLATVAMANGLDLALRNPAGHGNAPFVSRTHE